MASVRMLLVDNSIDSIDSIDSTNLYNKLIIIDII